MTHDVTDAPDEPLARRVRRGVVAVLWWVVPLVAAFFLWPTSLGGCTTLTVVSGHSMEPTYLSGDVVVARCGTPHVGDVVVYQPRDAGGARIIHRLIGGDGDGWTVQGDNNDFVDPFTPTDDEVVGIARLHLPKVGIAVGVVTSPLLWLSLIVVAVALLVWPRSEEDEPDAPDDTVDPSGADRSDEPDEVPAAVPTLPDDEVAATVPTVPDDAAQLVAGAGAP